MLVQVYCFVIRGVEVLNNSAVLFFNRTAKLTDKYIAICDFFFLCSHSAFSVLA